MSTQSAKYPNIRQQFTEQVIARLPTLQDIFPEADYREKRLSLPKRKAAMSQLLVHLTKDANTVSEHMAIKTAFFNTQEYQRLMRDIHYPQGSHTLTASNDLFLD